MNVGLYNSVSGLLAAQRAVDVTSHNISNSETEGYSRQRIEQSAMTPLGFSPYGQIGLGVGIDAINRIRDTLLDRQVREQSAKLGEAGARADALSQIEDILADPGDGALTTKIADYYDAWQRLTTNPENQTLRLAVKDAAENLALTFQGLNQQLQTLRQDLYDRITTKLADVNAKGRQIAELNKQITAAIAAGQSPNDLKDQQDLLIEQLSKIINVQTTVSSISGATNVYISGDPLVFEGDLLPFVNASINPLTDQAFVTYAPTGAAKAITGGEMKGLLDARNLLLGVQAPVGSEQPGLLFQLDQLAAQIINDTNVLHQQGFGLDGTTTLDFWTGTDAATIAVNPSITNLANGLDFIAAAFNDPGSLAGGPGDNMMAVMIAQRRDAFTMGATVGPPPTAPNQTFETFWKQRLAEVAIAGQTANRNQATQQTLVDSVRERRDQVSAVSTDEEMANVIRFQKAYAASAKMISVIDEMLDTMLSIKR